jgi:putative aldouronate transport system substrate-binding protein
MIFCRFSLDNAVTIVSVYHILSLVLEVVMKRWYLPALVLLFGLVTAMNVSARGSSQQQGKSDLVTLDVMGPNNTNPGLLENSILADLLREDVGVLLNFRPPTEETRQTMLASGDYADLILFQDRIQLGLAIEAGRLLNFDEYKSKLPNVFANVPAGGLQYYRDLYSNGTGNLYAITVEFVTSPQRVGVRNYGPYIRWDYYKELGTPELNEIEDYLPLLKKMQDAHPFNENGQRVYGISMFSDWDGITAGAPEVVYAHYGATLLGHMELNLADNTFRSITDNDSLYKRGLQFLFNANQMGILDPDSMTQTWSDYQTKATAGRTLLSRWPWGLGAFESREKQEKGIGYKLVPFKNEKMYSHESVAASVGTTGWQWSVAKNTKHLDKALAFLDYIYSWDGAFQVINGRKGVLWDVDENGEPYVTKLSYDIENGTAKAPAGYESERRLSHWTRSFMGRQVHPGYNRQMDREDWIEKDYAPAADPVTLDWREHYGVRDDVEYLRKNNMLAEPTFYLMPPVPDDIQVIQNRAGEVIKSLSWQMIYARNQAEFDSLWAQLVEQAKGRGIDREVQWYRDAYTQALAAGEKYAIK